MKHLTKYLTAPLAFAAAFLLFEAPSASASSLDTERLAKSAFAGIYDGGKRLDALDAFKRYRSAQAGGCYGGNPGKDGGCWDPNSAPYGVYGSELCRSERRADC